MIGIYNPCTYPAERPQLRPQLEAPRKRADSELRPPAMPTTDCSELGDISFLRRIAALLAKYGGSNSVNLSRVREFARTDQVSAAMLRLGIPDKDWAECELVQTYGLATTITRIRSVPERRIKWGDPPQSD